MARLYNRVGEQTGTTGTGTVTLAGDINETFATFAEAGVPNGAVVTYLITEGDDFEIGRGTYTSSGTTLSRDTVLLSKIGGTAGTTKMTLAGAAEVRIAMAAEDLVTEINIQIFTGSGTYTPTSRMVYCIIEVQAPGGGGGGADGTGSSSHGHSGGGGGGGEYARGEFTAADIGASQSVTIGAVGAGGTNTGGNGGTGGTTSVGSLITAIGGSGGTGSGSNSSTSAQLAGGGGGTGGTGGNFRVPGGAGGEGITAADPAITGLYSVGPGGGSHFGAAHQREFAAQATDAAGATGNNYGGGGGGARDDDTTGSAGGAGGSGIVIITEYIA